VGGGSPTLDAAIQREAWISASGELRWTIARRWAPGKTVLFVGLNPSTADAARDDPTVRRWMHFARAWGHGSFTAVNLYPYRSASVKECRRWADWEARGPDWSARDALQDNLALLGREAGRAALIVPCWGAIAWDENWIERAVEELQCTEQPLYCLGTTAGGAPIHPMARGRHRVPDDQHPILWRAA
jgi:hypothetical protein